MPCPPPLTKPPAPSIAGGYTLSARVSLSTPKTAEGQEVLVVDGDDKVLKGLQRLLGDAGLVVTATPDPARARDQLINKFFAVALCDIDTQNPGDGIELVRFTREKSPLTTIVVMTPRKAFDAALQAFRAGAADIVSKEPEAVPYLRERVVAAAIEIKIAKDREHLLEDVSDIHEEFLRRMMDLSKQLVDLEDRILGRTDGSQDGVQLEFVNVLVVDDDPDLYAHLEKALTVEKGWRLRAALTGGEALDIATQATGRIHVAIVKDSLPDLPGSMVIKTVKQGSPEAIALLYTPPARPGGVGEVKMVEQSRMSDLIPSLSDPEQLVTSLGEVREAFRKKTKERRYLQAFRQQHFEFLKRYNDVKQRVAKVVVKK